MVETLTPTLEMRTSDLPRVDVVEEAPVKVRSEMPRARYKGCPSFEYVGGVEHGR